MPNPNTRSLKSTEHASAIDPGLISEALELGSATLYEASELECFLPSRLRPIWTGAQLVGNALPVRLTPGDNLPLHLALEEAQPGDVLVVDAADTDFGYWGEVLTVAAIARGVAGLVIDGGIRDIRAMEILNFPAFSSHVALRGTQKIDMGSVGEELRFGSAAVRRGDLVVADADGVIVIPAENVEVVMKAARARQSKEMEFLRRLRSGETTLRLYQFDVPTES